MTRIRWRVAAGVIGIALIVAAIFGGQLLGALGSLLVVEDPLEPADAIVLTVDSGLAGVRQAVGLVRRGISSRVAVFPESTSGDATADAATARRLMRRLQLLADDGVTDVVLLPAVSGTTDEGPVLARWCEHQRLRSVIVVSLPDHSRRVRRNMTRAFRDSVTKVIVRVAPYRLFDSRTWWHHRTGTRIALEELTKLLFDLMLHPVS